MEPKKIIKNEIGFTNEDFAALLDKYNYQFSPGDIVPGTVFSLEPQGALIDIGATTAAYIPIQEMSINQVDNPEEVLQSNETREFYILSNENEEGQLTLSIRRIEYMRAWERVRQLQVEDVTVHSSVFATNRGGALVRIEGLRGFIPGSHISIRKTKEDLIGEELPLKFLEVDEERNRLVLSHRRALVERKMNRLEVGEVVTGTVRGIKPYGAFIDIGGVNGLLHISEISHENIDTLHSVFNLNDQLKVVIIDVDAERGRISLSTKVLESEPGDIWKNPQQVYDNAEEMAAKYRKQIKSQHDRYNQETVYNEVTNLDFPSSGLNQETHQSYNIVLAISPDTVTAAEEIEILIFLKQAIRDSKNAYLLQIPHTEIIGNELNIILNTQGLQFNGDNAASVPLDLDIAQETQTATFRFTALRPGKAIIAAEIYRGDTFETKLETQIQVTDIDEAIFTPQLITAQSRPVSQADFILRIQTIEDETNSTCKLQYQIKSFCLPSLFLGNNIYTSSSLSSSWIEQVRGLIATTLKNISGSLSQDKKFRLISLGQYLFKHLFPTELQSDIRSLIPRNSTFTILILTNQNISIPWELLHDGQRFLAERFIIGRWLSELNETRTYEFPVGAVNIVHYANVEQPELWETLLQPPGAPPPQPLPEGLLHNSTEAMRGLHLIRYSQSGDVTDLHNAPVRLDNASDAEDIETKIRPSKLNLRRNRPFVTLSYIKTDTPELTELEQTWASAFISAGCSGFTGSLWAVEPSVEAAFISSFYNSLWAGASLGEAFYTSRNLARAVAPDSFDWLAYVLFGDPMARPYLPVEGKGYAVVEPIGREIEDPLPPNVPIRFRLSLRRTPPVWHQERVIEVAENLTFENLQVHVKTMGLQVTPDSPIEMSLAPNGNYLGWFTLVAPPEMVNTSALVQVYFMDGEMPIHSLMFSLTIENHGG